MPPCCGTSPCGAVRSCRACGRISCGAWLRITLKSKCHRRRLVVPQARRRPVVEADTERETVRLENFLDLGQRLLAEIRRPEQLDLGPLDQIADVVDVLRLQAVGAANRQLELVD